MPHLQNLEGLPKPNFFNAEVKCCFITLKEPLQICAVKHLMAEQSSSNVLQSLQREYLNFSAHEIVCLETLLNSESVF